MIQTILTQSPLPPFFNFVQKCFLAYHVESFHKIHQDSYDTLTFIYKLIIDSINSGPTVIVERPNRHPLPTSQFKTFTFYFIFRVHFIFRLFLFYCHSNIVLHFYVPIEELYFFRYFNLLPYFISTGEGERLVVQSWMFQIILDYNVKAFINYKISFTFIIVLYNKHGMVETNRAEIDVFNHL